MAAPNRQIRASQSLRPPQFGLRTLLLLIAAIAALLALRQWLSPIAIAAIAFLAMSVFCHVAGNAIGTRLRQIGDLPDSYRQEDSRSPGQLPKPQDFAPRTQLSRHSGLGRMIIVATGIGATTGAVGGGLWTFATGHGHIGPFNIVVGVIAFAALGGIGAFAVFGFVQVLGGAIWQAIASSSAAHDPETSSK